MTTQQSQDFYVKTIDTNDESLYTTIYDATSGAPFRVKTEMLGHYLEKTKKSLELVGKELKPIGKWQKAFVRTKEEIIGSPSSGKINGVAPVSQVKAGKRRRGRRGRKK